MTAQVEADRGPIWFLTARDNALVQISPTVTGPSTTFTSKGHDLLATIHGSERFDNDRAVIDRLWNRCIAAWYQGGKMIRSSALLRLDPERAEIWLDASGLVAGIKMLLGADPKAERQKTGLPSCA